MSVVIPAYNPGCLLLRAIESVQAQTEPDFECIIVDDGSLQDLSWVAELGDPRITLVRQDNHGVSVARNVGVANSSAELVAFLDHDDEWLPNKLEEQLATVAKQPDAGFWYTGFEWVWPDRVIPASATPVTYHGLLGVERALISSCMMRRKAYDAVGGHNPLLQQAEDVDLLLRLAMWGAPPVATQHCLVRYHLHGKNASADYWRTATQHLSVLSNHESRARATGDHHALTAIAAGRRRTRELYAFQAMDQVRASFAARDTRKLGLHALHAVRLSPRLFISGAMQALASRIWRREY